MLYHDVCLYGIVKGEKYDGRRADVWSCGVILYALLVGALPFDDDNLRQLLEKVKRGVFHVPHFVPPDCQQLLRGMIEVNPEKRMTLAEITRHPWVTAGGRGELEQELPMMEVVQTRVLPSADAIDPDVLQAICSLGCFKQREKLIQELLSPHHNTEKVIYFLLLERKRRRPARDDEPRLSLPPAADPPRKRLDTCRVLSIYFLLLERKRRRPARDDEPRLSLPPAADPPRKRLDTCRVNGQSAHFGQISEGSPITPRRSQFRSSSSRRAEGRSSPQLAASPPTGHSTPHRVSSLGGTPNTPGSPDIIMYLLISASPSVREHHHQRANSTGPTISLNISGEPGEAVIIINESPVMGSSVSHRPHSPSQSHRIRERSSLPGPTAAGSSPVTPSFLPNLSTLTGVGAGTGAMAGPGGGPAAPWRARLATIKNSFLGSPRFHRRKMQACQSIPRGPLAGEVSYHQELLPGIVEIPSEENASPFPAAPWRARLATIKNSFLGSPRFHRRKMQASTEEVALTPESSPELTRRSWFGSLLAAGDKDETVTALVKGKPLATVKADLIHAFLSIAELSHSVLSPMSFRVEYKRGSNAPAMFQRHVRFQVDISTITKAPGENGKEYLYAITFTLLSGNIRRFRRVCEVVQAAVCRAPGAARPPAHPPSPRASRRHIHPHAGGEIPDSPEAPTDRQASDVDSDCSVFEPRSPNSHTSIDQLENGTHPLGSSSSVTSGSSGYKVSINLLTFWLQT
ncbi:protein kinase domain-containing protein [Phthorimaea operculella]|nr:protein kinase domain-containing protein [Phthorimaea operculella]